MNRRRHASFPLLAGLLFGVTFAVLLTPAASLRAGPPPGWTASVVGSPAQPGTVDHNPANGQTTVTGPGHAVDYGADRFQFIQQTLTGDGEIVVRVAAFTNAANTHPRAGLMLRSSLDANSPCVEIFAHAQLGVSFRYRPTAGVNIIGDSRQDAAVPVWLKLARVGPRVTAYRSPNGVVWQTLGAIPDTMTLPDTLHAGLVGLSNAPNGVGGASVCEGLALRASGGSPAPPATVSLVGTGISAGTASVVSGSNTGPAFVLSSNGGNVGGSTPGFLFVQMPFTGDGEIRARVTDLAALNVNSNVGLMIRDSLAPDALYVSLALSTQGLRRQHLTTVGGNPVNFGAVAAPAVWLRLKRHGALLSAFQSANGTAWQPLGKPFAIGLGPNAVWGLTMVGGSGNANAFAQATVDSVRWPQPPPNATPLDPVLAAGLASWRKPDQNGLACVDCHTPFAYDLAQFNFTRADVRLATTPHLPQADADKIFDMVEWLRQQYPPAGGPKNFRTHRPLQPGNGQVLGGENASANERDAAFGFYLRDHFRIAGDRIVTLAQARAAARELIDVNVASVPVGIKFNHFSRSVLREGPIQGGEIAEWLPAIGTVPKPEFKDYWFTLQENYLRDPSDDNFWAIYHATNLWTRPDDYNFMPTTHNNWRWVTESQFLANALFTHDELRKARGLPANLAAEDGVRPFPAQRGISTVELAPFWNVGDNARVVQGRGHAGFPLRNQETAHVDLSYNGNLAEVSGWQVDDLRLTWFWIGWMFDNSLRFSGEGSTLSGEYFIGSLWQGNVDNPRTGASDSSHGFRMHQVFFNAVHQFKLGFKPGAWRDNDGPQRFEASKGYYLGYYRWHTRPEFDTVDIGLPGANALYKRLLSNHLRSALLIHADEARKTGGVYVNEQFTLADLTLWRSVLRWADPDWQQADEALLADLKASIDTPLTATELGDPDGDGQPTIVEDALGTSATAGNAANSQVSRDANGRLALTFTRAREDYTYVVEASSDLAAGSEWSVVATNPGTVGASVTVADPASANVPRRFLRLRIIRARVL